MSKINIRSLFPSFYDGVAEVNELAAIENDLLSNAYESYQKVLHNQFVNTSNVQGILHYENILDIVANPVLESLEFRRARITNRLSTSPPFTFRFLKSKFDELIGPDKWEAYIDFENYTLYVESAVSEQIWLEEILVTMTRTKPCNMVFINKPLNIANILVGETMSYVREEFNYKLGVKWVLGKYPFASVHDKGVIKMPSVKSISKEGLIALSQDMLNQITKVQLNDSVIITDWQVHKAEDAKVQIEYRVDLSHGLNCITKVALLNSEGVCITNATVYIPLLEPVVMKHIITIKEG